MSENKPKKKYEKPVLTKVVLNPAQAVLSTCSTGTTTTKASGTGTTCKSGGNNCTKKGVATGDSTGQC
jgi:hypothetical protein